MPLPTFVPVDAACQEYHRAMQRFPEYSLSMLDVLVAGKFGVSPRTIRRCRKEGLPKLLNEGDAAKFKVRNKGGDCHHRHISDEHWRAFEASIALGYSADRAHAAVTWFLGATASYRTYLRRLKGQRR